MKTSLFFKLIYFDEFSIRPKYQQLANCITKAIEDGKLSVGYVLPSINELSFHFEICRVEKDHRIVA
jgi:DNA-binding transcriptional regulator YhcF (GntR family)